MCRIKRALNVIAFLYLAALATTAPCPASLQLVSASIAEGLSLSKPSNLTLPAPSLPPPGRVTDPYDLYKPDSAYNVEFYGYGPPLTFAAVKACCDQVRQDCGAHGGLDLPGRLERTGTAVRRYRSGDTYLCIYPGEGMTWGLLNHLQADIKLFLGEYSRVTPWETSFIVLMNGEDIAHGIISK